MTGEKRARPLHLDMPLDEALKRFAQTDPKELPDKVKLTRKKKGGMKPPSVDDKKDRSLP